MGLPDVSMNIRDGALGIVPPSFSNISAKFGVAAFGALNTIYGFTDPQTLIATLGPSGPIVESAALLLNVSGAPVYCIPVTPSVNGSISAVAHAGPGAGTVAVTAKPSLQMLVKIILGGATATATFQVSIDGGVTWSATATTSGSGVVAPSASFVTLTFTGGTGGSFVAGDIWTVTTAGVTSLSGTGTGTLSAVGQPLDTFSGVVTITTGGAIGTAQFQYSLDGGITTSGIIVSSATYVIPNSGLMLSLASTMVAGDTYSFTTTPPGYSNSDLTAAFTPVLADPRLWFSAHIVGAASSVANAAIQMATVDSQLATAANNYRFAAALIEVPPDTDGNIISGFAASSTLRVGACPGTSATVSPLNGRVLQRNSAWQVAAREAKVAPNVDVGRVLDGPLSAIPGALPSGASPLSRDEAATPALDVARLNTLRTYRGRNGFFITQGRNVAPAGSDYTYRTNRRVMDLACAAARNALLQFVNNNVRVDSTTGFIIEIDARYVEQAVDSAVRAAVIQPGYASDCQITVNRSTNILSTGNLPVTVRITPVGYTRQISLDIGFTNPALQTAKPS